MISRQLHGRHRHPKTGPAVRRDLELGVLRICAEDANGYDQRIVGVFDDRDLERLGALPRGQLGPASGLLLTGLRLATPGFHRPLLVQISAVAGRGTTGEVEHVVEHVKRMDPEARRVDRLVIGEAVHLQGWMELLQVRGREGGWL